MNDYSPEVRCSSCGWYVTSSLFWPVSRMPAHVLVECDTAKEACGALSIATREIVDSQAFSDYTAVEVRSEPLTPDNMAEIIARLRESEASAASRTELAWVDRAGSAGLTFAEHHDWYRRYQADPSAVPGVGETDAEAFDEWLEARRYIDPEGRIRYRAFAVVEGEKV
jgi:hypothetical protein